MVQAQTLSRNQQIVLDIIEKAKGPLKAYSILFNVQTKTIVSNVLNNFIFILLL